MRPLRLVTKAFGPYATEQILDFAELGPRTLFLIHGPTGAGKTTILDAMSYALYGECSGQDRDIKRVRSDHADPSVATEIVFDFRLGGEDYRIWRKPEQPRPKKGGGNATVRAEAALWCRTGLQDTPEEGKLLANKWNAVTKAVEERLGFRSHQFRQVVMLPQGEFRRLLLAGSSQRQEILEVLFQTQLYGSIEEALKKKAADVRNKATATSDRLKFVLEQAHAESEEELTLQREKVHAVLGQTEQILEQLAEREKLARDRLGQGRQVQERLRELSEAEAAVGNLEKRVEEFSNKRLVLEKARRSATILADERVLEARSQESGQADLATEQARKETRGAALAREKAEAELRDAEAAQPVRDEARRRLDRLEDLTAKVQELEASARLLEKARRGLDSSTRQLEVAAEAVEACASRLGKVKEDLAVAQKTADRLELLGLKVEETEKAFRQIHKLSNLRKDEAAALARLAGVRRRLAAAEALRERAIDERKSMEQRWMEGQAAILAANLSPGKPCPVCGATDHPAPARSEEPLPEQGALKVKAQEVEAAVREAERLLRDVASHEQSVSSVQVEMRLMEENLGAFVQRPLSEVEQDRDQLKAEQSHAEQARKESALLAEQCRDLEQKQVEFKEALTEAGERRQKALADFQEAQALDATRRSDIPEDLQERGALGRAKESAEVQVRRLDEAVERARKQAVAAGEKLAAYATAEQAAQDTALLAARRLLTQREEFQKRLVDAGFPDGEAFRNAKKSQAEMDRLTRDVQAFEQALNAAKDRVNRAAMASEGLEQPDMETLATAAAAERQKLESALQEAATLREQLRHLDAWVQECSKLSEHLQALEDEYGVIGKVAEVANGTNRERITFQRFVLAALLDDVLTAASRRLRIMSNSRFQLQRVRERLDRRSAAGLDLEVHDHYTGTARPVSTLSGGESFLASLSLALGLADVVQSYSGGIQLDAVFVDEGFGSLDPEALDLALQALVDLQRDGRLVGIISHVPTLREVIDARLEVTAHRAGSSARFVIGCTREG